MSRNTCSQLVILHTLQLVMTSSTSPFNPLCPLPNTTPKLVFSSSSPPFRSLRSSQTYSVLDCPVVRPMVASAKGPGLDSPITQHVQRVISRALTYGAVGSLVLSWSWARQPGIISFRCLWIQLCNNLG